MRRLRQLLIELSVVLAATTARADIFQWEYVNPADPSQGKRESAMLASQGAGANGMSGADLSNRNLTKAYLIGKNLNGLHADNTNLTEADLSYSSLRFAWMYNSNLTNANLSYADLESANLYYTTMTSADLTGARVRYAGLSSSFSVSPKPLSLAQIYSTASYQQRDLTGIGLSGVNLAGANFSRQTLKSAEFYSTDFTDANLSQADLKSARLAGATLSGANLAGADIIRANLSGVTGLTPPQLYSTASYKNHDLRGIDLWRANLSTWNFAGQNLSRAQFVNSTLTGVNFSQANLTYADLRKSDSTGGYIQNVIGADFSGAQIRGAAIYDLTAEQLYSTASYQAHDLSGVQLYTQAGWNMAGQNLRNAALFVGPNADFKQANLTNATLGVAAGANFRQANLTNATVGGTLASADLTGAEIRGASLSSDTSIGLHSAQLYATASYQAKDLRGVGFGGGQLAGANLVGQNLTSARFTGGTLIGADFSHANLSNAKFDGTNLAGADFTDADIRGAHFGSLITKEQLYATASYKQRDLSDVSLVAANLSGWDFSGQKLVNAGFGDATLTGANFTGADVRGAYFSNYYGTQASGLTADQLYSTANYQARDLSGIQLYGVSLTGWNFAGQNLTHAILGTVTGADFTDAVIRGASMSDGFTAAQLISTASYQARDLTDAKLSNVDLTGVDLSGQIINGASLRVTVSQLYSTASYQNGDLSRVDLSGMDLKGVDLSGQIINGTNLGGSIASISTGVTASQLYSTASYQAHDLSGVILSSRSFWGSRDMTGWNFAGQNLQHTDFTDADLTGSDFTGADVRGARIPGLSLAQLYSTATYQRGDLSGIEFYGYSPEADFAGMNLSNGLFYDRMLRHANLSGADLRGVVVDCLCTDFGTYVDNLYHAAHTDNAIHPDGHIDGVHLGAGQTLTIRDYDGGGYYTPATMPITVDEHFTNIGGTLRIVLKADAWDSTISFSAGVPVTLGGTLELTFADDVNLASQIGRTIDLFDWTGVNPSGAFAISSPYTWDLSKLYTTGQVTLTAVPEPATAALLLLAGACAAARLGRNRVALGGRSGRNHCAGGIRRIRNYIAASNASTNSAVVARPPRSPVRTLPRVKTCRTAFSIWSAAACSLR